MTTVSSAVLGSSTAFILDAVATPPSQLLWLVVVASILAFTMAYGIGANDVANAFATSFGSRCLTLRQVVVIAGLCEFVGAAFLGSSVSETVRKGIVDYEVFQSRPDLLMLGMTASLAGASAWVLLASRFGLPVSTTHSIVGAIVGFGVAYGGGAGVHWETIGSIVASWFVSPLLAAGVAACLFLLLRRFVLRHPNSLQRAYRVFPAVVFFTMVVNVFFFLYKGGEGLGLKDTDFGVATAISLGVALVITLAAHFLGMPFLRRRTERIAARTEAEAVEAGAIGSASSARLSERKAADAFKALGGRSEQTTAKRGGRGAARQQRARHRARECRNCGELTRRLAPLATPPDRDQPVPASETLQDGSATDDKLTKKKQTKTMFSNIQADEVINESRSMRSLHDAAEQFKPSTEALFASLQVLSACFNAISHGANDTSNAIGAFSAIVSVYTTGHLTETSPVEFWMLAAGGLAIVVGLATYGYRVMSTLGLKVTQITPSRGFIIELSAGLVVLVASKLGIPMSTTHAMVGATIGVGLCESNRRSSLNYRLLLGIFGGWIVTLVFAGAVSAGIFAFSAYSPGIHI